MNCIGASGKICSKVKERGVQVEALLEDRLNDSAQRMMNHPVREIPFDPFSVGIGRGGIGNLCALISYSQRYRSNAMITCRASKAMKKYHSPICATSMAV